MTITFASIEMMPWLTPIGREVKSSEASTKKTNVPKKTKEPTIKHPLFAQCAEMTGDEYWQHIFTQASHNKLPENFSVCGRFLMYRHKGKYRKLELPSDPHDAFVKCKSFFRDTICMMSTLDRKVEAQESSSLNDSFKAPTCWKDIKNKNRKNVLLQEYINTVTIALGLSINEKKQLQTVINCGVQTGLFSNTHIILVEGLSIPKVGFIKGLLFDNVNRYFTIDVDNIQTIKKCKTPVVLDDDVYLDSNIKLTDRFNKPLNYDKMWLYWLEHFNPSKPKTSYHVSNLSNERVPTESTNQSTMLSIT